MHVSVDVDRLSIRTIGHNRYAVELDGHLVPDVAALILELVPFQPPRLTMTMHLTPAPPTQPASPTEKQPG